MKSPLSRPIVNIAILLTTTAALTFLCEQAVNSENTNEPGRRTDITHLFDRNTSNVLDGFRNMYNFHILHEPGVEHPFKMWFFGWTTSVCNPEYPGCDAIFHGRSKSLKTGWEIYAGNGMWDMGRIAASWVPVVSAQDHYFDEWHNGDPTVVKVGDKYFMAYSSTGHDKDGQSVGSPKDTDGSFICIMGATSNDGINWTKSRRPILAYEKEYGAKESIGDVVMYGSYARPSLLHEDGVFRLWFDYWTEGGVSMGYAENPGEFLNVEDWKVIRAGSEPVLENWPNPTIVRTGNVYYSYADPAGYDPHPWKGRKICEAVSKDGLSWKVNGYIDTDHDASATHVPEAFVIKERDQTSLYVYYACQVGGEPYDYTYDRIRAMRRLNLQVP